MYILMCMILIFLVFCMFIVFKGCFSYIIYKYFLIWDKEEVYEFYNYMRWEYVINI